MKLFYLLLFMRACLASTVQNFATFLCHWNERPDRTCSKNRVVAFLKPRTIKQSWFQINHPPEYLDTAALIVQLRDDQDISSDWKLVKNETKKIEICSHHNQNCHFLILMPQRSNRIEKNEKEICQDRLCTSFHLGESPDV